MQAVKPVGKRPRTKYDAAFRTFVPDRLSCLLAGSLVCRGQVSYSAQSFFLLVLMIELSQASKFAITWALPLLVYQG